MTAIFDSTTIVDLTLVVDNLEAVSKEISSVE